MLLPEKSLSIRRRVDLRFESTDCNSEPQRRENATVKIDRRSGQQFTVTNVAVGIIGKDLRPLCKAGFSRVALAFSLVSPLVPGCSR